MSNRFRRGRRTRLATSCACLGALLMAAPPAASQTLFDFSGPDPTSADEARRMLLEGEYDECRAAAREALNVTPRTEWYELKIRAELATGRYAEALATFHSAKDRDPFNLGLRLLGRRAYRLNDRPADGAAVLKQSIALIELRSRAYSTTSQMVDVGRTLLAAGWDSRQVLKLFFDRAKGQSSAAVEAHLAAGELALDKHDYRMAGEEFQRALRLDPDHPDLHFGVARAFARSDWQRASEALQETLEINPKHTEALLFAADHAIDGERYDAAEGFLKRIEEYNAKDPMLWAYRAALAEIRSNEDRAAEYRTRALSPWKTNPAVDHLIGRKLSEKYRFREGAEHQRTALEFDPDYPPAKTQLSQDLLRLAQEEEGWRLAAEAAEADQYDILAHNLTTLREHLQGFATLRGDGFVLRMDAREAKLYGPEALRLLAEAREKIGAKYEAKLPETVVVEVFPRQQDFAIRTFGLPGGAGYLGVCFGPLITATSPAAQGGSPSNWQSVLWHEFCHVATLTKTNNKMPRWLSEGISVYEERQRDPAWGLRMDPSFREMALSDDLTPVSKLSSAFLQPESGQHLQFAYYESSMVVEYLIEEHGFESLLDLLDDLGDGVPVNAALGSLAGSIAELDEGFADYLRAEARALAPGLDWERPPEQAGAVGEWAAEREDNYYALKMQAQTLMRAEQWEAAKGPLEKLIAANPDDVGPSSPYPMLAECHEQLGETDERKSVLSAWARRDDDSLDAYLELMRSAREAEQWEEARGHARRALAVNPLLRPAHEALARAAEQLGRDTEATRAYEALLAFDATDLADVHYRLALLAREEGDSASAKRHVLQSIEEAPRNRDAFRLLVQLREHPSGPGARSPGGRPDPPSLPDAAPNAPGEEAP